MTRDELRRHIIRILDQDFELPNVVLSDNLFDVHGFDSLDVLDLLARLEKLPGITFTRREKDEALRLGTLTELLDHIEGIMYQRKLAAIAEETAGVKRILDAGPPED